MAKLWVINGYWVVIAGDGLVIYVSGTWICAQASSSITLYPSQNNRSSLTQHGVSNESWRRISFVVLHYCPRLRVPSHHYFNWDDSIGKKNSFRKWNLILVHSKEEMEVRIYGHSDHKARGGTSNCDASLV